MAAVVAPAAQHSPLTPSSTASTPTAGVNKRYRPAPAKTFQCRGYGECRMVFSRSEHLARHIRKHTGERPFTCHCGKQFSRLDNLRQHAQTVHADKQDSNERMMHELTSLHASMTAANKGSNRSKRAAAAVPAVSVAASSALSGSATSMSIKQEDGLHSLPSIHQRPGTSTGYEGGNLYHTSATWHVQTSEIDRPSTNNHSFRDPGQSFRGPTAALSQSAASSAPQHQYPGQSFLVPTAASFQFGLPELVGGSRPGSSSGPAAQAESLPTLPPLSAVVSSALASPLSLPRPPYPPVPGPHHQQPLTESHILPLPTPSGPYGAHGRRPSTAARPGTAPASYYYASAYSAGAGGLPAMGAPRGGELSLPSIHTLGRLGGGLEPLSRLAFGGYDGGDDREPTSPGGAFGDSPFSFHAPATVPEVAYGGATSAACALYGDAARGAYNPRKRPHEGSDDDEPRGRERGDAGRPPSSGGRGGEYEYGSDSRPQSRRLSVMELCNDTDADGAATGPHVPLAAAAGARAEPASSRSRPTTSSAGLVSSAAQLALVDRGSPACASRSPGPDSGASTPVLGRAATAAGGAATYAAAAAVSAAGGGGTRAAQFGGGVHAAPRSVWHQRESAPAGTGGRSPVLSTGGAGWGSTPGSPVGGWRGGVSSPRGDAVTGVSAGGSPRSVGSGGESHGGNDQVRIPAVVGMRA
ncbi:uncharacterized protein LAESUDRAFT_683845 [Laetiporus sulphureus 93-53]|uniref:C2H2-type domain-containing protein n=1 Tax=Laetiporus sulphureus 93-53 TaxID=1314785 RepID=A0A165CSJ9_9APHY|nr:uncharacterized protein LAESUDRAFT_683845 [Laetiporus sulphureus 93-53]KZT03363.1 hypothetical protein LAESUDRAFT_683845 [Laetiporus sulphureus 93-53]